MKTYDFDQAAKRLGVTESAVARMVLARDIGVIYRPNGAQIPKAEVDRVKREREAKLRRTEIGEARALVNLPRAIEEEKAFLHSVGRSSSRRLEALTEDLAERKDARRPSPRSAPSADLRARGDAVTAQFEARMATLERRPAGTYASRVRTLKGQHRLPANLRVVLQRFAARAHSVGRSYETRVNGQTVTITPAGEFLVGDS